MKVNELSKFQLEELKQHYLMDSLLRNENRAPSWMELVEASDTVPDSVIMEEYAEVEFSEEDFVCTTPPRAAAGTAEKERWEFYRVSDGMFTYYVNRATGEKKYALDPGDVEVPAGPDDFAREN